MRESIFSPNLKFLQHFIVELQGQMQQTDIMDGIIPQYAPIQGEEDCKIM